MNHLVAPSAEGMVGFGTSIEMGSIWSQAKMIKDVLAASLIVGAEHHLQCNGKAGHRLIQCNDVLHSKVQISFVFLRTPRGHFWKAQLWVGTPAMAHGHMEGRFKTADILRYLEKKLPSISIYIHLINFTGRCF